MSGPSGPTAPNGPTDRLFGIAEHLLPGVALDTATLAHGQFHDVVLVPGVAAVRVARTAATAAELPRRSELLRRLDAAGLPFAVPCPLGPVTEVDGSVAVAVSWVGGVPQERGTGDPTRLAALLAALAAVAVDPLADVLARPYLDRSGRGWVDVVDDGVLPLLPARWHDEVRRRVDAVLALPPVPTSLVHCDLVGANVHWLPSGEPAGVLDWDFAQEFDPAFDAACLAWHGWDVVREAVDAVTYARARTWSLVFGIEHIGAALIDREPPAVLDRYVSGTIEWLERTCHP